MEKIDKVYVIHGLLGGGGCHKLGDSREQILIAKLLGHQSIILGHTQIFLLKRWNISGGTYILSSPKVPLFLIVLYPPHAHI